MLHLDDLPPAPIADFSPHQAPSSSLLRELRDGCGVDVVVVGWRAPPGEEEVRIGLSEAAQAAVEQAAALIAARFLRTPPPQASEE